MSHPALAASNLGQVVGRLALGLPLEGQTPTAAPSKRRRASRYDEALAFLAQRGWTSVGGLALGIGITNNHAGVLLHDLHSTGEIERSGERGGYRYRAKGAA